MMTLLGRCARPVGNSDEGAHLAFACGLTGGKMAVPELTRISRRGAFGRQKLTDAARAHAVLALAWTGDPFVAKTIIQILESRGAGIHTRRSAALALGRLLRGGIEDDARRQACVRALKKLLDKASDPMLGGFCAVALGGARPAQEIPALMHAVDKGGAMALKPFAALALGIAARESDDEEQRVKIGRFLLEELSKSRETELTAALALSLGLARHDRAIDDLVELAENTRRPARERGAAVQALGLTGKRNPKIDRVLFGILTSGDRDLIEDTALALGMMRRRSTADVLVKLLSRTSSDRVRGSIILALGHLGSPATIDPLLKLLVSPRQRPIVREFAAVALGLIADPREEDVLFEIDADFNYFATTVATNELIRLY